MSEHVDHTWEDAIMAHSHLGFPGEQRCYDTIAPTPLAVAVTAQIHALARRHPPGTRLLIGRKWIARMHENAEEILGQAESLRDSSEDDV